MMGRVKETMQLISDSYDELIKGEGKRLTQVLLNGRSLLLSFIPEWRTARKKP